MSVRHRASLIALGLLVSGTTALNNGLALTPQMGWNTWNTFGCQINQDTMLSAAKEMKKLKLDKYGYRYVVMDDCWSLHARNASGYLQYDPQKFPKGIKWLADQIHDMGFGWGMYSDAGNFTCGRFPGSLGYEEKDAALFAEWGVDYLKYDNCYNAGQSGTPLISYNRYKVMSDALNRTGRPILYSMCNWGEDSPWDWAPLIANSWRMSGDVIDQFDRYDDRCPCTDYICRLPGHRCSVMNIINKAAPLGQKAFSGAWNDLDMLEVGKEGLTFEEQKLHFTIWAMVKSPLILGHDIMETSEQTLSIITNREILDLSQGDWGTAYRSYVRGDIQVWLQDGTGSNSVDMVVAVLNSGEKDETIKVDFADVFLDDVARRSVSYKVTDLWEGSDIGTLSKEMKVKVKKHGIWVGKLVFAGSEKEKPKIKRMHADDEKKDEL